MKIECKECGDWLIEKRSLCSACFTEDMEREFKRGILFACTAIEGAVRSNHDMPFLAMQKAVDVLLGRK